jgi:hypothetical protein
MSEWLARLHALQGKYPSANSANSANRAPEGAIGTNGTNGTGISPRILPAREAGPLLDAEERSLRPLSDLQPRRVLAVAP